MGEGIFRKKSLDKIKSPENLDDYIRVSNPPIWLFLASIIILLVGVCIWSIFGYVDSSVDAFVYKEDGVIECIVPAEKINAVKTGMTVEYAGRKAVIDRIGDKKEYGYECSIKADSFVPDGMYDAKIIIKRYKPISFVLN